MSLIKKEGIFIEKGISMAVIKRLPRYYRYLCELKENGVSRTSSMELSKKMRVTASQIRQDLNNFGCFGQQGYGYGVDMLINEIKKILGLDRDYNIIIIGAGRLGTALAAYPNFYRRGFNFVALFDIDTEIIGDNVKGVPIIDMNELENFVTNNPVDIAALCLPHENAQEVFERVSALGIKGVWNFSHMDLQTAGEMKVENVHLTDSLMTLSYLLNV
ncbi:MAG: redox-sensing transcriptional repressor Rex [Clostridiales bacterium]|jgi:redox-sensing transcriptional repressor|nr:redox-sensing transcriptional repressor Rex [Clostridiales bacterium]